MTAHFEKYLIDGVFLSWRITPVPAFNKEKSSYRNKFSPEFFIKDKSICGNVIYLFSPEI